MKGHIVLRNIVETFYNVYLAIRALTVSNRPTVLLLAIMIPARSDFYLQRGPSTAITPWNMGEVAN